jgi:hypothetical protein
MIKEGTAISSAIENERSAKAKIIAWELTGAVLISVAGSLLHFAFDFFNRWPPLALIAAVNESTWEHLKLAFWPALIFALIERPFFRRRVNNFWTAKAAGILAMPLVIISVFYGYTALAGRNVLWADISVFVLAVFVGQMLSSKILLCRPFRPGIQTAALIVLALMIAAFLLLTFFPPHLFLFCDPRTGQYGLLK